MGSLTTNRYQPPENMGDPLPPREAIRGSDGQQPPPGSRQQAAGMPPLPTGPGGGGPGSRGGVGAGGSAASQGGAFMPFAMPTYAIPTIDGRGKVCVLQSQ